MKPSRKPKVKRTDWRARCKEWQDECTKIIIERSFLLGDCGDLRREVERRDATLASLTEQIKAKDARIAELAADLQATRDRDDELMAAQRERLIRMTEIKNAGILLMTAFDGVWNDADQDISWELNGTSWVKQRNVFPCLAAANTFSRAIAALEVDSTLPGIPPKEKP